MKFVKVALFSLLAASLFTACGPKATKEDCEKLTEYTIKLGLIDSEITYEQFKALPAGAEAEKMWMDECVGKMSQSDVNKVYDCFKAAGDNKDAMKKCAK